MTCNKTIYSVGDNAEIVLIINTDDKTRHQLESIKSIKVEIYSDKDMTNQVATTMANKKGWSSDAFINIPNTVSSTKGTYYMKVKAIMHDDTEKTLNMPSNIIEYQ